MSIEKSEVKRATALEIGNAIEDVLEQARIAKARKAGEADAWQAAAKSVEGVLGHVSREVDEDKLDLEQAKIAKTWLMRVVKGAQTTAASKLQEMHIATGKVEALEQAVTATKRIFDREDRKVTAQAQGDNLVDLGDARRARAEGTHPGMSIKERRLAESRAAKAESPKPTSKKANPKKAPAKKAAPKKAPAKKGKAKPASKRGANANNA